jgi:glycosyltransferase involved in cell wall biosynthesis
MENNSQFQPPRIAVCVITRCRADGLTRALQGVAGQRIAPSDFSHIRVVVIDNDPASSGQPVCDRLRPGYPYALDYALEPETGIPQARNRAIEMTMSADDLMVFLDDDEVPSETWLLELLRVWREYTADVVLGPVGHYFPEPVPRWIERGAFFDRQPRPTGTVCTVGWSGNVLISTHVLRESGLRFDESYRLTGGSDIVFFKQVYEAGYRMIWADEALATEWIPKSRATLKWLAMRNFRIGALEVRNFSALRRLRAGSIGLVRIVVGAACAVALFPFARHLSAKAVRWASYGVGLLYGITGKKFDEYRKVREA